MRHGPRDAAAPSVGPFAAVPDGRRSHPVPRRYHPGTMQRGDQLSDLDDAPRAETPLTGERAHVQRLQPYLDARPRSIVRSGAYLLLDGEWRFHRDSADRGLEEGWYRGHEYAATAPWPGSVATLVEDARPGIEDGGAPGAASASGAASAPGAASASGADRPDGGAHGGDGGIVVWYERDIVVPEAWRQADHPIQLTFGACGYETRVWLDGQLLRTIEGEEVHLGEYTSFSFELPERALTGEHRLTVRVADSLDPDRPRGKQESHVYKRGGIWYQSISGPVRSVWLEPIERNRVRSRLSVVSQVDARLVEFGVTTRVRDAGRYRLRLVIAALDSDEPAATKDVELDLEPGERRQHVVVPMDAARPWSPAAPVLYRVIVQLRDPAGRVSQIETRFGMREVAADGPSLHLNGEPIYLDGILYQPGTASFDDMRRHLFAMRELGCNLVRVHITGIDPRIYALADEIGMLLWVEVPSPHRSSPTSRAAHWAELQRMLVHVASQPSVVMVSLYNESWGAEDIGTEAETRAYIARVADFLRAAYPQFLVVDNDGWQHISVEGRLESDVLTAHVYTPDLATWERTLDALVAGDTETVTALPLVVGDPYFHTGQVPLVVSEWGGFGFPMYGGPEGSDERADRIRAFKRALRGRRIAGDVYTQATSVEQEVNGLIDATTGSLLVPPGILGPPPDGGGA